MQSENGAAAVALLREMEARDRAEQRRRERDVEDLEQRAEKARMEAIGSRFAAEIANPL